MAIVSTAIAFLLGVGVLVIILSLLTLPFKIIMRFIINSIIAGIILVVLGMFGITIVLTWWAILLIGFMGVPGLIAAFIILKFFV